VYRVCYHTEKISFIFYFDLLSIFLPEDILIEYIPDLDEVQEEDLTMTVAAAPEYWQKP
jgi:Intraflagellar transport protein 43